MSTKTLGQVAFDAAMTNWDARGFTDWNAVAEAVVAAHEALKQQTVSPLATEPAFEAEVGKVYSCKKGVRP